MFSGARGRREDDPLSIAGRTTTTTFQPLPLVRRDIFDIFSSRRDSFSTRMFFFGVPCTDEDVEHGRRNVGADQIRLVESTEMKRPGERAVSIPPVWRSTTDEIVTLIHQIESELEKLRGLHGSHLRVSFSERTRMDEEQAIEIVTSEISALFNRCQVKVTHLSTPIISSVGSDSVLSPEERIIRKNLQIRMAQRLQRLSLGFRREQEEYLRRLREQQSAGDGFALPESEEDGAREFYDPGLSEAQKMQIQTSNRMFLQRKKDMELLEASISDLNVIFKDLALLIIDQGTVLDRIDYNIEQTVHYTERAVKELKTANVYHKKARKKYVIIVLLCAILFLVLVLLGKNIPRIVRLFSGV